MTQATTDPAGKATLSAMLEALDGSRDGIAVSDLLAAPGDRALAALLFGFAVPNVLPVPPGTSAILGAPLVFLAAQLALGRRPWLPAVMAHRGLPPMEYLIGLVCLLLTVVLVLPVPLGNMLPALVISLLALGVLERDGVWILTGLATAGVSSLVVFGVVFGVVLAMVKAAIYFATEVLR